jgi:hypothetical protein
VIGNLDSDTLRDLRASLCWIPTLGGGLGMSWTETGELTLGEALELYEWATERRGNEVKGLAGKRGQGAPG